MKTIIKINPHIDIRQVLFVYVLFCFAVRLFFADSLFDERAVRIAFYSLIFVLAISRLFKVNAIRLKMKEVTDGHEKGLYISSLLACASFALSYIYQLLKLL